MVEGKGFVGHASNNRHFWSTPLCKMRQSTALHATRRNQVSAVVRQAKHYCVDRDADLQDVVADPPRLPG